MNNYHLIKSIPTLILLLISSYIFAQNVGIGLSTPDPSAKLDIVSTNSGLLIPRMTTAQRSAIASPATGLMVFDNTTNSFWFYNGTTWTTLSTNTDNQDLSLVGNILSLTNDGTPVNLSTYLDNTDNQTLTPNDPTGQLSISGGNTINISTIADADANTKVQVEEGANDDIIRFDLGGAEYFNMNNGRLNVLNTGASVFIGSQAGLNDDLTSNQNVFIGDQAGRLNTGGGANTFIGTAAGRDNLAGGFNTFLGHSTGLQNTGWLNTYIGSGAGRNATGGSNVCLGVSTGENLTGSGNVMIGNNTGRALTNISNRLYIDNSQTVTPLIYGEFDTDILRINGTLQVNNPTATGYAFPTTDGTANQVLQTNGVGQLAWTTASINTDNQSLSLAGKTLSISNGNNVVLPNETRLIDTDGDTKIDVEESADEDRIRIDIAGTEYYTIDAGRIQVFNTNESIFIGQGAGENAFPAGAYANTFVGNRAGHANTSACCNTGFGWGTLEHNTGQGNTAIGSASLWNNTLGNSNTAIGWGSLQNNTTGANNTALGRSALLENTTGLRNSAVGRAALQNNMTGINNVAMGQEALFTNTIGTDNIGIGYLTLYSNTSGNSNTAIGGDALYNNTTGYSNTAIGRSALQSNTTGYGSAALGIQALYSNTTGINNVAVGRDALYSNTTGIQSVALGHQSLYSNTTGGANVATGVRALHFNTTGYDNTALGAVASYSNTTGIQNTALGYGALQNNTTGSLNTAIGRYAGFSATGSGNVFLGQSAGYNETGSNKLYIDNSNTNTPLIYGDFTSNIITVNGSMGVGTTNPISKIEVSDVTSNTAQAITIRNADVRGGIELETQSITNLGEAIMNVGVNTDRGITSVGTNPTSAWFRVDTRNTENSFYWIWEDAGGNIPRGVMRLNSFGDLSITGSAAKPGGDSWAVSSDKRLKKNIQTYTDGLATVMQIKPKTFQYNGKAGIKDTDKEYVGILAQDIQKIAPYMVREVEYKNPTAKEEGTYLEFDPSALDFMLINATQELVKELDKTKQENQELKTQLTSLQNQVEHIQAHLGMNTQSSK
ncbi:MAG: hypothetical protein GY810_14185 [Aureispira sp.]|nr:hypothetical protein [Aureispira sp.]